MKFNKHIFICTNQRPEGARKCCGEHNGMELVRAFKSKLKEKGLTTEVRAQRAGCLDACETGPSLVVYPDGIYYGGVTLDDVDELIEKHIVGGIPVTRLIVDEQPKNEGE